MAFSLLSFSNKHFFPIILSVLQAVSSFSGKAHRNGASWNVEINRNQCLGSAGTLGPLRDKLVLSALLNVFLLNKAVGNARTVCSYPLTLGTGEGIPGGSGASISRLHSHASNVFTLGHQNCSSGPAPGDQLHVLSRQDQATLTLANSYTFLSLRCVLKAISPCSIE